MPGWADWLIWLGQWMRQQAAMDGRRVAIVRLPTRRLSAAFVCLGALLVAARLHEDALDWQALKALPKGTRLHWRVNARGKSRGHVGFVDSVRDMAGSELLGISIESPRSCRGSTFLLPSATALSYGVTLGAVAASDEERLSATACLIRQVVDDASLSWIRSGSADSTLVTERTGFLGDLHDLSLSASDVSSVAFEDALSLSDISLRQHGKLRLVPSRTDPFFDVAQGLTVLDGASAAMRLGAARARSIVVLLDHAEHDQGVAHAMGPFLAHSVTEGVHVPLSGVVDPPPNVEVLVFGLPESVSEDA